MSEVYEYRRLHVPRGHWARVVDAVHGSVASGVHSSGGTIFGLWTGLIGAGSDEGVLMSAWPNGEALAQHGAATVGSIDGVESSHFVRLTPTLRPLAPTPPTEPGCYAIRWFSLDETGVGDFLDLSEKTIWSHLESLGCRVVGCWRSIDSDPGEARVLQIVRYPTMAHWDRARLDGSEPPPGVDQSRFQAARSANLRRADLTQWMDERIMQPARLASS
jgi:hypothetical protein